MKTNTKLLWLFVIGGSILFIVGNIQGAYLANKHYIFTKSCIQIPDHAKIAQFCKDNGYEYGWLSDSSCDGNQVMCHRDIFDLVDNRCVDWKQ